MTHSNMNVRKRVDVRLITLCTTCFLLPATACPSQCVCNWKDGKRSVNCLDQHLKAIPSSLDPETQVLDFAGNDLQVLQKEHFHKLNLVDLQKIYVQRCRLQKVDNRAFYGLRNLVELNFSNNNLTVIPFANFEYVQNLMKLSLNNNTIKTIKSNSFRSLSFLITLELTDCEIEIIERGAFSGLHHLEKLSLNDIKISNIQGENLFPNTLQVINLQNNNWNCDCHLRIFHSWLLNFNKAHSVEPICSSPERLRKQTIMKVAENELACLPIMDSTNVILETNFSSNVTLECLVKAVPGAKITWLYQGHIIRNYSSDMPGAPNVYFVENGNTDKKSELYLFNVEENYTYTCLAENAAGRSRANFTIKVLAKEEPVVVVVTFPQIHLVVIVTVIFLIFILLIVIIAVVLLNFKTDIRSRKKKESGKDVALCNQNLPSTRDSNIPKNNNLIADAPSHHALHYTVQRNRDYELSNVYQRNIMKDVVDRNLDLISDAETLTSNVHNENRVLSVYKAQSAKGGVFQEETTFTTPIIQTIPRQVTWQDRQNMNAMKNTLNHIYEDTADVHLNPGYFLDNEGYPYGYRLPKHSYRPPNMSNYSVAGPFYQTLPHNRLKNQNLNCKYSKDTEFNATPPTRPNFKMFGSGNVKRTLDGYPLPRNRQIAFVGNETAYYNEEFVPSPPEGYKSEPTQYCTLPDACSSCLIPKGTCAVMVPINVSAGPSCCYQIETRCVDTQTTDARIPGEGTESVLKLVPQVSNAKCVADICSESPNEGHVGDANDIRRRRQTDSA